MKSAPFDYVRATDVAHAIQVLADADGDAKVLAGGQSLVPLLAMRLAQPTVLVDLGGIGDLAYIRSDDAAVEIGAMTRTRDAETSPLLAAEVPLLTAALPYVGHVTVRNRGTIGGSAAHADPAAELPSVLRALDAELIAAGPRGRRSIAAADFFLGFLTPALEADELLVAIRIPRQAPGTVVAVEEFARRHGDFAMAAIFTAIRFSDDVVAEARISAAGLGQVPIRAERAENILTGASLTPSTIQAAAAALAEDTAPVGDIHAPADYRRHLAAVLTRRCLETTRPRRTAA
ncbi:FAD binding domain-containing protein [Amycolatopsis jejuensis]|uniref:FAD binding domain-containing protein n=1 Tax=Amycolatopsis jejuensis TaxID=330084 RepID=UPI000524BA9C|nr:xanthine dehydrogenase family protein subunit M [Amycolatopsis jejuensis]